MREARPVVLFDGVCCLCSAAVRFLIRRDTAVRIAFAPLQSEAGHRLLSVHYSDRRPPDGVVLIERDRVSEKSTAVLRVARYLRAPWPALYVLIVVPTILRDWLYDWLASHRYAWFGRRSEVCRVPEPNRFLE